MRNSLLSAVAMMAIHLFAAAVPAAEVAIGDHSIAEGTASFDVPVLITGGESLKDMAGVILVGGGGTLVGNPVAPEVTAVSYVGSIWTQASAPGGFTDSLSYGDTGEVANPNINLNGAGESVLANGTLLSFTLNLTGFTAGQSYSLSMGDAALQETQFVLASSVTYTPTFDDGSITIVPEPSSFLLGSLAILALSGCRRLGRRTACSLSHTCVRRIQDLRLYSARALFVSVPDSDTTFTTPRHGSDCSVGGHVFARASYVDGLSQFGLPPLHRRLQWPVAPFPPVGVHTRNASSSRSEPPL